MAKLPREFKKNEYYRNIFDTQSMNELRLNKNQLKNVLKNSVYSVSSERIESIVERDFLKINSLGLDGSDPRPVMNIPLSSSGYELEFLSDLHSHPSSIPAPEFVSYETKLAGFSLRRLVKTGDGFEERRILYQPASEIRAAIMTSSKQEIFDKIFRKFGANAEAYMNIFERAYRERMEDRVVLDEIVMEPDSRWDDESKKKRFIGNAGRLDGIVSLSNVETETYAVSLKNPSKSVNFRQLMLSDPSCYCGTQNNTANSEGTIVDIHCHHIMAAENVVNRGLKEIGSVKITDNAYRDIDSYRVAKFFEPLSDLNHPLAAKFVEWYYFKKWPLWKTNLNLMQFPSQILNPELTDFMVKNYHIGYGQEVAGKRFRIKPEAWDYIIDKGVHVGKKGQFSLGQDFIVSFPKWKNNPQTA